MYFLLVNDNPAISRLITLSIKKMGHKVDEILTFDDFPLKHYDMVFIDDEQYDEASVDEARLSELSNCFVCIVKREATKQENIDLILEKPFLPTDFIDMVIQNESESDDCTQMSSEEDDIALDLYIDSFELEDESKNEDGIEELEDVNLEDDNDEEYGLDNETLDASDKENNLSEEQYVEEEELDSILSSKDIDEVKQLLEDDDYNHSETTGFLDVQVMQVDEDSEDIENEIQTKVAQSVKEALSDSSIKDALKGMKVNVSITFEEDN